MAQINKCANSSCSAVCDHDEGKFFRLDIDLGNIAGQSQRKTLYLWLCARCAQEMNPKVEVIGDTVTILLASTRRAPVQRETSLPAWVN